MYLLDTNIFSRRKIVTMQTIFAPAFGIGWMTLTREGLSQVSARYMMNSRVVAITLRSG